MPDYFGRYRAEQVVGSGAFATVWLARDETLDAAVAIKVLAENWAHDPEVRQRFIEEARILWRANSDHIVRIHNVEELPDGRPYFVMDFADRGTLQQRMAGRADAGRVWAFDEAIDISLAIADGLKVAHALGIVHRDLKPANIMFQSVAAHHGEARDEKLILTDFGMAKSVARSRGTTIATGTPFYMAPEQTEGRADERSDVYAAGVVLYELLSGRVPYAYDTPGRLFAAQLAGPAAPVTETRPDVPPELAEVVRRAIATEPGERWPSAEAWAAALVSARDGVGVQPAASPFAGLPGDLQRTLAPEEIAAAKAAEPAVEHASPLPVPPAAAPASAAASAAAGDASPPATPPAPPAPSSGGAGRPRRRRAVTIGLPVAGVVAAVAVVAILLVSTGTKSADAKSLTLVPAASVGLAPFTPTVVPRTASQTAVTPNPTLPGPLAGKSVAGLVTTLLAGLNPAPGKLTTLKLPKLRLPKAPNGNGQPPAVRGSAYGLYGGTQLLSVCDKKKLIRYLLATPDKARAWAEAQGIPTARIASYIGGLTDVVLQADTRVTNHGFVNGLADPIDEVLQAGTAVLVDPFGIPRARCYCGNPLTPPRATVSKPLLKGSPWPGFTLTKTIVVEAATTALRVLPTSDVLSGETFILRPVGSAPPAASVVDQTGTSPAQTTPAPTATAATTTAPPATTAPATTAPATTTAPTTTAPPQLENITADGTAAASSTFSSQFPVSAAVDGDVTTSWFSIGDKEGPNSTYTWTSTKGTVYIGRIQIVSNAQNSDPKDRTGFGFTSVTIQVLKGGSVVWTGTGQRPGDQDVTVDPKVEGDTVRLTLMHHESPACGGFAELRISGAT